MPIQTVTGDPLLTRAQTLAFGFNLRGKPESDPLAVALNTRYPAAFATFRKLARQGRFRAGGAWLWRESQPRLAFWIVRESPVGMTRLRFVEAAALTLARDYRLDGIASIAIAPLGTQAEWSLLRQVLVQWLARAALPVALYTAYAPGVTGETATDEPSNL